MENMNVPYNGTGIGKATLQAIEFLMKPKREDTPNKEAYLVKQKYSCASCGTLLLDVSSEIHHQPRICESHENQIMILCQPCHQEMSSEAAQVGNTFSIQSRFSPHAVKYFKDQAPQAPLVFQHGSPSRGDTWCVDVVNDYIAVPHCDFAIGILDIFGFEHFETNSFEQLCINFANEKLQQQFNADVFRQQQLEYEAEGVPWQRVDFTDNAAVLELLEAKHVGVFALLDEESRLQKGNAESYVEKLKNQQKQSAAFSVPKGRAKGSGAPFSISHYAGLVTYDTALFISKNTDPLHPELVEMMQASNCAFLAQLFTPPKMTITGSRRPTGPRL